jgi:hypothetical protein
MIRTIREACRRLERSPYYRQLTRSQGGPGLWSRILITVGIAGAALGVALLLRWWVPGLYQPAANRLMGWAGGLALLVMPTAAALVAALRTHAETQRESFTLVGLAAVPPPTLVDSLAGAALHAMWPLWALTSTLVALLGASFTVAVEPSFILVELAISTGVLAFLLNGAALWFGVWAGVTSGLRRRGRALTVTLALLDANLKAAMSLTVALSIALISAGVGFAVVFSALGLLLDALNLRVAWLGEVVGLAAVTAVVVIFVRIVRSIFDGMRVMAIIVMEGRV